MKKLFILTLTLGLQPLLCDAQTTPMLFPVNSLFGGAAANKAITITAANTLQSDGTNIWAGTYQILPATNGSEVINLYPGSYLMKIAGVVTSARFTVPASTSQVNVATQLNSGPLISFGTAVGNLPVGLLTNAQTGVILAGSFSGDISGGTNLTTIRPNPPTSSGTMPLLAVAPNGSLLSAGVGVYNATSFAGDGSLLTGMNFSQLGGNLAATQLPANVVTNTYGALGTNLLPANTALLFYGASITSNTWTNNAGTGFGIAPGYSYAQSIGAQIAAGTFPAINPYSKIYALGGSQISGQLGLLTNMYTLGDYAWITNHGYTNFIVSFFIGDNDSAVYPTPQASALNAIAEYQQAILFAHTVLNGKICLWTMNHKVCGTNQWIYDTFQTQVNEWIRTEGLREADWVEDVEGLMQTINTNGLGDGGYAHWATNWQNTVASDLLRTLNQPKSVRYLEQDIAANNIYLSAIGSIHYPWPATNTGGYGTSYPVPAQEYGGPFLDTNGLHSASGTPLHNVILGTDNNGNLIATNPPASGGGASTTNLAWTAVIASSYGVVNSTTYSNTTAVVTLPAGTFILNAYLAFNGGGGGSAFQLAANTVFSWSGSVFYGTAGTMFSIMNWPTASTTGITASTTADYYSYQISGALVTTTVPTTFTVQIAQKVSNASATSIVTGSYISFIKTP